MIGKFIGSLFGGLFDKKKKVANGLDMMASGLNRVNSALRNVPSGYKVARAQFGSTSTDNGAFDPVPTGMGGKGGPIVVNGDINVQSNNPQAVLETIERAVRQQSTRGGVGTIAMAY